MKIDVKQLNFLDPKLRDLLVWLEEKTGFEFTITSLYRIGDKGVHGTLPLRGGDLRVRNSHIGTEVMDCVNNAWSYDMTRVSKKCAYLHGEGSNLHLHIQVHPNTNRFFK